MGASQAVRKLNCDLQAWLFAATQVRCVQEHWQAVVEPRAAQRVNPPRHLHLDSVTVPPGTSTLMHHLHHSAWWPAFFSWATVSAWFRIAMVAVKEPRR